MKYSALALSHIGGSGYYRASFERTATPQTRASVIAAVYSLHASKNDEATKFRELADQWKKETIHMSSLTDMVLHPAYLQIIAMGKSAIPYLIDELRTDPDHWFVALSSITQEDPVSPEDEGNLEAMTESWLEWADHNGY
jgi:hypothetical protein